MEVEDDRLTRPNFITYECTNLKSIPYLIPIFR